MYVGESIPVTVRAYFRSDTGVTVTGQPTLNDATFTLASGDSVQGTSAIDGVDYRVLTWKDHLAPIKEGHHALSMSIPSTLEWQDAIARRAEPDDATGGRMGDPFGNLFGDAFGGGGGDPFAQMQKRMQQMMNDMSQPDFGPVQKREVTLRSPDVSLEVKPLPLTGRPAGFSDAVGHFTLSAIADSAHVRVGEPFNLALTVKGDGNFDRVKLDGVPASSDWKTYAPSATQGADEKRFTQPIVALHAGSATVPPTSFSYFDPDAATYVTLKTAPIAVDVSPGSGAAAASNGQVPDSTSGPTLAPNADVLGRTVKTLTPLYLRAGFWEAQAVALAVLVAGFAFGAYRKRIAADPHRGARRASERALRERRAEMSHAAARGDAPAFFSAARAAIQERLGTKWSLAPAAISLSEIRCRLTAEEAEKLGPIFDADALRFSGRSAGATDLAHWKSVVENEIDHLAQLETS